MPKRILTQIKKKLKMLVRYLDIPKFWGPLLTVLCTVAYHVIFVVYFGFDPTPVPLLVFLVLGTTIGGLRAGLICAAWLSLYGLYAIPDPTRVIQIVIGNSAIALVVGYQSRIAHRLHKVMDEMLNGNVEKMRSALNASRGLLNRWDKLSDAEKKEHVQETNHFIAHLLTGIIGYRQIRQEQQTVEAWFSDPNNVRKSQVFETLKDRHTQSVAYLAMALSAAGSVDLTLAIKEAAAGDNGLATIQAIKQAVKLVESEIDE